MAFAAGKYTWGICDTCGQRYRLKQLQEQWDGYKACPECFDIDHPQLKIGEVDSSDNQSLFNPRPDRGEKSSTEYFGFNPVSGTGLILRTEIGKVKVSTG